jgi:hypothetical protein
MTNTKDGISPSDFQQAEGLEDWRVLGDGAADARPKAS